MWNSGNFKTAQEHAERLVTQCALFPVAGEYQPVAAETIPRFLDDRNRLVRQRNAVPSPRFHSSSWDRPRPGVKVNLIPRCADYFTSARGGEDQKLEG